LGNDFYLHQDFVGRFSAGRNPVLPLCHGIDRSAAGLSPPLEGDKQIAGIDLWVGGAVRDMLILPAGEYRAHIHDGIQRRGYHFCRPIFYGAPVPSLSERGKAESQFLYRFCRGYGRNYPYQLQRL